MPAQDTPATPDELATLYLRARDVPCPACGYNRRDGTTAACPECGKSLCFATARDDTSITYTASAVSVTIACCAVIVCGGTMITLLKYWPGFLEYIAFTLLLGAIICTIFGVLLAVKSHTHGGRDSLQDFIGTLGVATVLFTVGMMLFLWGDVF